ncbi:protein of unknown function [Thiomonas sp. Bio17B3]|nr:hypothetical protein THICB3100041 [Thiomonas sp. CB3]VDY04311.1 protein of unknown function [Thiomonas sp. Bio17B3]VDY08515.1 protein of unknown function [Thiomonas sp. Sup16B3]VDY12558.1 conserved protein of unknown function [Thiomonas sp. OC7]VDY18229.1 protein of unknown function [Thiomonas sp. CB2]
MHRNSSWTLALLKPKSSNEPVADHLQTTQGVMPKRLGGWCRAHRVAGPGGPARLSAVDEELNEEAPFNMRIIIILLMPLLLSACAAGGAPGDFGGNQTSGATGNSGLVIHGEIDQGVVMHP